MSPDRIGDFIEGFYNSRFPEFPLDRLGDGSVVARFYQCRLSSVFQPVFDGRVRAPVGHKGLIRCYGAGGESLSPWGIFSHAADDATLVQLDRVCRTLHVLNFIRRTPSGFRLFVTVQPRLLLAVGLGYGRAFQTILEQLGVATSRVVIELPEDPNLDWDILKLAVANYRSCGYAVALSHAPGSHDRFAGLKGLYPDILKVDPRDLGGADSLKGVVDVAHRHGAQALVHRIESPQVAGRATRAGADFVQGNYFSLPSPDWEAQSQPAERRVQGFGTGPHVHERAPVSGDGVGG
ncbi:MAG: EAL domain-containing protein [Betaproteobacteria bacterium]|nr:EAL domain-containing protein [Betaproteobacteria bacterium]